MQRENDRPTASKETRLDESSWPTLDVPVRLTHYSPGSTLFHQGDEVVQLHLLEAGAVKVVRSANGQRDVIVAIRYPGWMLGMAAAILGERHPATVVTLCHSKTRTIAAGDFQTRRQISRPFAAAVETALAADVLAQVVGAGRFALRPRLRLRHLLNDLAISCGQVQSDGLVKIDLPITQSDLADVIGVTREHVNRLLGELEAQGVVQRRSGWILANHRQLTGAAAAVR